LNEAIQWVHAALRVVFDHLERRQRVLTASVSADPTASPDYTLALEKHLEDMLVDEWESLPWATSLQYVGRQVPCGDLGFIDILARDNSTGDFVVIELKRNKSDDEVVGQLTRYMGGIKEHRADPNGVGIRGIIVVHAVTPRLRAAVLSLANVELYNYKIAIELTAFALNGKV
jgi:RecB family endonuclease NucS